MNYLWRWNITIVLVGIILIFIFFICCSIMNTRVYSIIYFYYSVSVFKYSVLIYFKYSVIIYLYWIILIFIFFICCGITNTRVYSLIYFKYSVSNIHFFTYGKERDGERLESETVDYASPVIIPNDTGVLPAVLPLSYMVTV